MVNSDLLMCSDLGRHRATGQHAALPVHQKTLGHAGPGLRERGHDDLMRDPDLELAGRPLAQTRSQLVQLPIGLPLTGESGIERRPVFMVTESDARCVLAAAPLAGAYRPGLQAMPTEPLTDGPGFGTSGVRQVALCLALANRETNRITQPDRKS